MPYRPGQFPSSTAAVFTEPTRAPRGPGAERSEVLSFGPEEFHEARPSSTLDRAIVGWKMLAAPSEAGAVRSEVVVA